MTVKKHTKIAIGSANVKSSNVTEQTGATPIRFVDGSELAEAFWGEGRTWDLARVEIMVYSYS